MVKMKMKTLNTRYCFLASMYVQYIVLLFQHRMRIMMYFASDPDFYVPTPSKIQQKPLFLATAN